MSDDPKKQNPSPSHSGQQRDEESGQQQNRYPDDPQKRPSQSGYDAERDQQKDKQDQGRKVS